MNNNTHSKPITKVLYLPSQMSDTTANIIGVVKEKTKKALKMFTAVDWPSPKAPGTLELPRSYCM